MQRSANSVPLQYCGRARKEFSPKEYLYHISVSLGSIAELETQLILCGRVKFLSEDEVSESVEYLRRGRKNASWHPARTERKTEVAFPSP